MSELARLETSVRDGVLLAAISGEIDVSNAAALEERLADAAQGRPALVIDLTQVTFLDSAGVRLLDHLVADREPAAPVRIVVPASGAVPFTLRVCGFRPELLAASRDVALSELTEWEGL